MTTIMPMQQWQPGMAGYFVPVATAIPMFAMIPHLQVPEVYQQFIPPDLWGVVAASNSFTVRQHVKVLPKSCCTCPPCAPQENTYSVYAGVSEATQTEILRVDEVSDEWNRVCCRPYHPVRLELRQYVPIPGIDPHASDWTFLQQDLQEDFQNFSVFGRNQRAMMMKNMYNQRPVILSMLRHDGTRCCYKCPCKQLDTFVCFSFCQDGMSVYAGPLYDDPNGERGRPYNLEAVHNRLIGSAKQPCGGGICWPTFDVFEKASQESFATVTGPFFFGGWCELCCNISFDAKGKEHADMARLIKMKPTSLLGSAVMLFTDAAVFTVAMNPDAKLSPERKLTFLTGTVLADYMFFDGNTEPCYTEGDATTCNFCYCSLLGRLTACSVTLSNNDNNNGN